MIYYKYRNFNNLERLIQIFEKEELYASDFDKLNDPMDSFFEHNYETKEFLEEIKNSKLNYKILSLSKSFNNILMWTHYADEHRGLVLGVEVEDNIYNISYKKNLPFFNSSKKEDKKYKKSFLISVLKTKLSPWKYEEEVRILASQNQVKVKIKEVYFGLKAPDELIDRVRKVLDCKNIKIKCQKITLDELNTKFTFIKVK